MIKFFTRNRYLLIFVCLFTANLTNAQCTYTSSAADVTLQCSGGTSDRSGLAFNPIQNLYYSVNAGSSGNPIETFSITGGAALSTFTQGVDYRGFWWNPNTGRPEGNTASDGGVYSNTLNASFYATNSTSFEASSTMPQANSVGAGDLANNQVIYYNNSIIYRYSRSTGTLITSVAISSLPVSAANLASLSVVYTGIPGLEAGVYDFVNKRLYLINYTSGVCQATCQLPVTAPANTQYGVAFANNRLFLYNTGTSAWIGYPIANSPCSGSALNFDGTDDFVNCGSGINLNGQSFTVEFWAKRSGTGSNDFVLGSGSSGSLNNYLHIGFRNSNDFAFAFFNNDMNYAGPATTDGNFHHWACVYNANTSGNDRLLYLDGNLVARDDAAGNFTGTGNTEIGNAPLIGSNWFNGLIDELRIWNVARTHCEIQTFMSCEIPTTATGLLANYHFNQGAAALNNAGVTSLIDAAGANTGTLTAFSLLTGTTSNWVTPGGVINGSVTTNPPLVSLSVSVNGTVIPHASTSPTLNLNDLSTNTTRTFTVQNTGTGNLYFTTGYFSGPGASQFNVTVPPSSVLATSATSSFIVVFTPTALGTQTAVLNIITNDCTNPTYSFVISASSPTASALHFDGSNDDVSVPHNALFNITNSITIEAWVNTSNGTSERYITAKNNDSWFLAIDGGFGAPGKASFYLNNVAPIGWLYSTTTISDGNWHHIAGSYDGTVMKIYVDGLLENQSIRSGTISTGSNAVEIGSRGGALNWDGAIDELRIWNAARTQCQIQSLMHAEIPSSVLGLVANYHFNQGLAFGTNTITSLTDASGNALDGTLNNFNNFGTTSNWISPGGVVNSFTTALVPTASISVSGNGNNIPQGSSTPTVSNFTDFGTASTRTFVISNTSGTLNIGAIYFTGPNAALFSVTTLPASSVTIGGSGFVITLTPTNTGVSTATVNIPSNDCINATFSFVITASTPTASALNFDGINDYVSISDFNLGTSDFTMESWIKPSGFSAPNTYILSNRLSNFGASGNWFNLAISSGQFEIELGQAAAASNTVFTGTSTINTGNWYHVAVTRSGLNYKLYVNGILETSADDAIIRNITGNFSNARIGGWPENGTGRWFNGNIDEVRVWNVAHNQCEIQTFMNAEIPTTAAGLVANYHFNQGVPSGTNTTITSLIDAAGANTGTLTNFSPLTGSVSNWVSPGAVANDFTTAVAPTANFSLTGNGNNVPMGSSTTTLNNTDFGTNASRTFSIYNAAGTGTLNINAITFTGPNAAQFSVTTLPLTSVTTGTTGFVITLTPTNTGISTATVNISSNDCTNPTFSFVITASTSPASALSFDGNNDVISIPSQNLANQPFTIEFWAKRNINDGAGDFIFSQGSVSNTNAQLHIGFRGSPSNNNFTFGFWNNDLDYVSTLNATDGNFHHWACVFSPTATIKNRLIYRDGILVASDLSSNYIGSTQAYISSIRGLPTGFDGTLDEFRIWNVARTQCEIQTYMNAEITSTASGLVANYHFNQGIPSGANSAQTLLIDAAGANTGTLTGPFALTGSTSNWVSPGAIANDFTTAVTPTASIAVSGNGNNVPQSTATFGSNNTDFGTNSARTFSIYNAGGGTLNINAITFTGPNAAQFSVTTLPLTSVTTGTTGFVITLTPTNTGISTATVSISSNDCTNPTFSFVITASTSPASALSFDGSGDLAGGAILTTNTANVTMQAKVNWNGTGGNQMIMYNGNSASAGYGIYLNFGSLGNISFLFGGVAFFPSNYTLTPNVWTSLTAVIKNGTAEFYVNGILTSNIGITAPNTPSLSFNVGCNGAGTEVFNGKIDEVLFWNKALTQCEIQTYQNCEIPTSAPNLLANYHFNQGVPGGNNSTITTVLDASGNSNNLTLTGFALTGTLSNWVSPGAVANDFTTAVAPTANFSLTGNGNNVPMGSSTTTLNNTDFGTNASRTFSIYNPGGGTLNINTITFTGPNAAQFSVTTLPLTSVTTGTTGFVITLTPTNTGISTATVNISSNDCTNTTFSFVITASTTPASALDFDNNNDYVNLGTGLTTLFDPLNNITLEAWVKPTSTVGLGSIVGNWQSPISDMQFLLQRTLDRYSLHIDGGSGYITLTSAPNTASLNVWQHVAGVWDGSQMRLYINGVLQGTLANSGSSFPSRTNNVLIGGNNVNEQLTGSIDEVRVWNTARTQCQIQTFMNCEIPTTTTGLLANYHFNQGIPSGTNTSVTTLTDATGTYNGTLTNFATLTGSTSNWVSPGGVVNDYTVTSAPSVTLALSANGNNIPVGVTTNTNNNTDFGTNSVRTFSATNTGTNILYINSVTFTGANAAQFSVNASPVSSLAASGSSTFSILFTPTIVGTSSAVVHISSNDCTNPTYSFVITASASPASALNFDGVSSYVQLQHIPALVLTNTLSIEAWIKPNALPGVQFIFSKGNSDQVNGNYALTLGNGNPGLLLYQGGFIGVNSTLSVSAGAWSHVVGTWDGLNLRIYVNGVLGGVTSYTGTLGTNTLAPQIGRLGAPSFSYQFGGAIDELRVWNTARTQCEIQTYMNAEITSTASGLVLNYHFNQGIPSGSNTAVTNLTDAAMVNTGTLTNFALTGTVSNWISPGGVANDFTTAVAPTANFSLTGNANNVPMGSSTNTLNNTDFDMNASRTFSIYNAAGTGTLNINAITFTGPNAAQFSVTTLPLTSVTTGTTGFVITLTPTNTGISTATVNISSNDCTNPTFSFVITATTPTASALSFDGIDDYVEAPHIAAIMISTVVTVEAWAKPTTNSGIQYIVSKGPSDLTNGQYGIVLINGVPQFHMYNGGHIGVNAVNYTATPGVWAHYAGTWDGNTFKLYINGVLNVSGTYTGTMPANTGALQIGRLSPLGYWSTASIDEVRIWNIARTQCEIQTLMNAEIPTTASGLVANYHFNHGIPSGSNATYSVLTDASANSNNGVLNNMTRNGPTSNWVSPGAVANDFTTAVAPTANFSLTGNGNNVPMGSLTTTLNNTDFGTNAARTFSIYNPGGGTLNINTISFTGPNAAQFSVTTLPASSLTTGGSSFVITLTPTNTGISTATVNISSNDCTNPTFSFVITASTTPASALAFDGVNDYIQFADPNLGASDFTLEQWIKPNVSQNAYLLTTRTSEGGQAGNWFVTAIGTSGNVGLEFGGSPGILPFTTHTYVSMVTPTNVINIGSWNHIAAVRAGNSIKLYVNGIQQANINTPTTNTLTTGNNILYFGAAATFSNQWFNGSIDEVRIWNTARTQCELQTFMNAEIPTTAPGLLANYHFNQGIPSGINTTVTTVMDATGTYPGALNGFGPLTGSISNWVSPSSIANGFTTAIAPTANFSLTGNGNNVPMGSSTNTLNNTDFGTNASRTFSIYNAAGTGTLNINTITFTGPNAAQFSVTTLPLTSVTTGTTGFVITLTPTNTGISTATVNISSNDCINPTFSFVIIATTPTASALNFDGTNDQVLVGTNSALDIMNNPFTFEAWVFPTFTKNNTILSKGDGNGPANNGDYIFQLSNTNQLSLYMGSLNAWKYSTGTVPLNQWSHVAAVYTGSLVNFYINGVLNTFTSVSTNTANSTGYNFYVGRQGQVCNCNFFRGSLDEVRVWNVAHNQCEIQTLMNAEIPTTAPGLLANYHFNQGIPSGSNTAVTTLIDATGSNNGTLTNFSPLTGSISNWVSPGAVANDFTTAVAPTANFSLTGNSNNVPMGSSTNTLNNTDFGTNASRTFSIYNAAGTGTLSINTITFTGPNAAQFSVTTLPLTSVTTGTTGFVITLTPTNTGISTATVNISSNDCTNPTFSFVITANTPTASALSFDGTDDYVNFTSTNLPSGNSDYTVEFWVKLKSAQTGHRWIYSLGTAVSGSLNTIGFDGSNGNRIRMHHFGPDLIANTASIPLNVWTHVAINYHGTTTSNDIYINGQYIETLNFGVPLTIAANPSLQIGTFEANPIYAANVDLDEMRIWNVARNQCEIQTFMNAEIPTTAAGLVANYHFNQGIPSGPNTSVNTLIDAAGANTGNLTNFSLLTGSVSNWVSPGAVANGFTTTVAPTASISVSGNGNNIPQGSTTPTLTNFTDFGTASTRTFVISNTSGTLNIATPYFTGPHASEFSISVVPASSLTSSSTSFVVAFTPTVGGLRTATLNIATNDCVNPNFNYVVQGIAPPASALNFDGSDDYVSTQLSDNANQSWSFSAWIYPTALGNPGGMGHTIVGADFAFDFGNGIGVDADEIIVMYNNGWSSFNYTTTLNAWTHIASVTDLSAGTIKVYVNGVLIGTNLVAFTTGGSVTTFSIGHMPGLANGPFQGSMDEVRIFNTVLSQCDIQTYMNCEIPTTAPGLLANYHFNQGAAGINNTAVTTLTDAAGVNTGTLTNFSLLTGTVSNWVAPSIIANGYTTAVVPTASMAITGNGNAINAGSTSPLLSNFTDFGTASTRTFVIQRTGSGTLYVNNPITIAGVNASDFTITAQPSSSVTTGTTNFVVGFIPAALGTRSAIVVVNSSDCGTPNYSFVITATATAGAALNFDGINDFVSAPVFNTQTTDITLQARAYWNGISIYDKFIVHNGNTATNGYGFYIAANSNSVIAIYAGINVFYTGYNLTPNQWTALALVIENNKLSFYANGVLTSTFVPGANPAAPSGNLTIGDGNSLITPENFNGSIDEVLLWSRALSQCEIQAYQNCEIATTASSLVANYHFNQGIAGGINPTVTTLTDATGNGNNLTLSNFTLATLASNWVAPGAVTSGSSCAAFSAPEINLVGNGISIPDGKTVISTSDHTDFGDISTTGNIVRTYTIQNTGAVNLAVTTISMSGADASMFLVGTLSPASPISASSSAVFSVTFAPSSIGTKSAIVNIINNDCDEAAYDFVVSGTSTVGAALSFDGNDDYVNCGNILPASYTKEAWIKINTSTISSNNLISSGSGIIGTAFWAPGFAPYNYKLSAGHNNTWAAVQDPNALVPGTWYHVAVTYDAPSLTMNLYKNGLLVSSANTVQPFSGTDPLSIGAFSGSFVTYGTIDEVRIWNRPLCLAEIVNNMSCEIPTTAPGLLANYHFNQGVANGSNTAITTLIDASGNNNTGTLTTVAGTGTISNWVAVGGVTSGSSCATYFTPEINAIGNGVSINDGASTSTLSNHTDFGGVCVNGTVVRTFTVQNTGNTNLSVSSITLGGTHASLSNVGPLTPASPIAPGNFAVFSVSFTPTSSGVKTTTIYITNTDCNESPYDFVLTGTCNPLPVVTASATGSVICNGVSTILNGGGADTYTWTGGPPTVTNGVAFTPSVTLNYTVSGTNTLTGCTSTNIAVQGITVNPNPTITATSSHTVICSGFAPTLTAANANTYTWNPGVIVGNSITPTPSSTTVYSVAGTNTAGCVSINTVVLTVSVNALPTVTATSSSSVVCVGFTTSLSGSGADTYSWTGGITNGAVFSPTSTQNYSVTGTNTLTGCVSTNIAVQTITVESLPVITVSTSNSVICAGSAATIIANGANTYTWNPGSLNGATITPSPSSLTSYTVVGTNSTGCTSTNVAVQTISVNSLPTVSATISNSVVCSGTSITVNGSGATTYSWSGGITDGVSFTPTTTTTFTLTGTNSAGCTNTNLATVSVTINTLPQLIVNTTNSVICVGDQTTLNGSGASTYTWSGGITNNIAFSPTITTSYTLIATDANSCENDTVATITVNPLPTLSVSTSNSLICEGITNTLTASGALSYTWNTGQTTSDIIITPTASTVYTVTAIDLNGCSNNIAYTLSVTPCFGSFSATAISKNATCKGKNDGSIVIKYTSSYINPQLVYVWNTSTLCPGNNCDSITRLKAGSYSVTVRITYTVSSSLVKTDSILINPITILDGNADCEVKVFNGISANNDGVNDVMFIENIEEFPNNKVSVYNRWGQEVFKINGYNNQDKAWPLSNQTSDLPTNTYFYIIDLGDGSNVIKGWIELIKN